jgi:L-aspartate oxidase
MSDVQTDFLIVGGGVAGLRAAIEASRHGRVILLNKGVRYASNSEFAQGGIAAALNADEAAIASHRQDTLDAGCGLCRPEAVQVLVEEGLLRVQELIAWGAEFDKVGEDFALATEGAHRHRRILRARGDATGYEIVRTLFRILRDNPRVTFQAGHFAADLLMDSGICRGVWVLSEQTGQLKQYLAKGVILATGGAGQVYRRTTNPEVATGDGIALALRAGAVVEDMEFVQFHPTALSLPSAPSFLLSEAMRGEGAILCHADGGRFAHRYHPDGEMAPRDVVTRAIWEEMRQGRAVYLDITHLGAAFIPERFPRIYATCLRYGVDITKERIPVAPSAHYLMGGVKTSLSGETTLPRLWAVGEVACTGVHGANRLASNALLEGLVFGARAGEAVAKLDDAPRTTDTPPQYADSAPAHVYASTQKELREMMWNEVGVLRSGDSLGRARMQWAKWAALAIRPASTRLALETANMLLVSAAMIASAASRKESLGAHTRTDASAYSAPHTWHTPLTLAELRDRFMVPYNDIG